MIHRTLRCMLVASTCGLLGCPSEEDGAVGQDTFDPADTASVDSANDTATDGADTTDDADIGDGQGDVGDTGEPESGKFGARCTENDDCDSGWCISTAEGPICTRTCLDECPAGFACLGITGEQDVTFLCVPRDDRSCQPCLIDVHCGSGYCITMEDGPHCTASCGSDADCVEGFSCQEIHSEERPGESSKQCVPQGNRCDCGVDTEGTEQPCAVTNAHGSCWGLRTCLGAAGWGECDAEPATAEVCDGLDNDCNNVTDEFVTNDAACTIDNAFGSCPGNWYCRGLQGWSCEGAAPAEEVCDYQDNDCDGLVDNGFRDPETGVYGQDSDCGVCGLDCTEIYPHATSGCQASADDAQCVVTECAPGYFQATSTTCLPALDVGCLPCAEDANCAVPGNRCVALDGGDFCTRDCGPDNLNGLSEGQCADGFTCTEIDAGVFQCLPATGSCSCLTAEDHGATRLCNRTNALGTCAGSQICDAGAGGWTECSAPEPSAEVCDGVDNDCDGTADEGVSEPQEACFNQEGAWRCYGTWQCQGAEEWQCLAQMPADETCNFQDDNCDGDTDEGFVDALGRYVQDDHCGTCGYSCDEAILFSTETMCAIEGGVAVCVAVACEEDYYIPESSNRVCVPTSGATSCSPCSDDTQCNELTGGACTAIDGGHYCTRSCTKPADCDDGYGCVEGRCLPDTGSCSCAPTSPTGGLRPCADQNAFGTCTGTQECRPAEGGWTACSAREPAAETCNGEDDDCNGQIDELVSHEPAFCEVVNAAGRCTATWVCEGEDGWQCPVKTPVDETCNFQDDNCADGVDETFRDAAGVYNTVEHCGSCGTSCVGTLPNASARCDVADGVARCVVDQCDEGFYQVSPLTCLPATDTTCLPCVTDANCPTPGDLCLDRVDGRFCGRDCGEGNVHGNDPGECPMGFRCQTVGDARQCVPTSDSCACLPADEGDLRTCSVETSWGICFGSELCVSATGWELCTAETPSEEVCDGVDNDCDNLVDEGLAHDPADCSVTNAWGTCTADWACTGDGGWKCDVQTPGEDVCDGVDNDCDSAIDEDFRDAEGRYVDLDNCGSCGISCAGTIPNATAACVAVNGVPRCQVSECEAGYFQAGALTCLPAQDTACQPCVTDANCPTPGDRCLALEGGSFCGRDCGPGNAHDNPVGACDPGFACAELDDGATFQCVPTSGACSCLMDDDGSQRTCQNANGWGTCFGVETCDVTAGWIGCTAGVPAEEVCNGLDDDCDLFVDEGLSHAPPTCENETDAGVCTATWTCAGDLGWQCAPDTPVAEVCNFADDNCNGEVDETFRDADGLYVHLDHCGTCGASCDGVIPNATAACDPNGGSPRCEVVACASGFYQAGETLCLPVSASLCNPCENDADCPTPGDRCVSIDGHAFCGQDCSVDNRHALAPGDCGDPSFVCTPIAGGPDQCVPLSGTCDCLLDNDTTSRPCSVANDSGTCFGSEVCDWERGWVGCTAATPADEACNGVDDDCDNLVDEGLAHDPPSCSDSNADGVCTAPWTCTGEGGWQCDVDTPVAEVCNFADDNCNDAVDETFRDAEGRYVHDLHCGTCGNSCEGAIPNATASCQLAGDAPRCQVAACADGYYQVGPTTCLLATDNTCTPCQTDANCPTPGDRCLAMDGGSFCGRDCAADNAHDLPAGQCPTGFSCEAIDGGMQCVPTSGTCTCLADDAGSSRTCSRTTTWGTCYGTEQCSPESGWGSCTAQQPDDDVCDGQDNDCDGLIDEDLAHDPATCSETNAWGTCTAVWECTGAGGWSCDVQTPAEDVCDGRDNDCDNEVDEDFRNDQGRYVHVEHCGGCGLSCVDTIPNATETCAVVDGVPRCQVATCDEGYFPSGTQACLPAQDSACLACVTDANCPTPGDTCLTLDDGKFCGRDCSASNVHGNDAGVCDAGYICTAQAEGPPQCVPESGACSCLPADDGAQRTCSIANASGTCYGVETCDPAEGWGGCTAKTPTGEICNGLDDDCDALVDEGLTHDPTTCAISNGNGVCTDTFVCAGASGWICLPDTPAAETCNFADDNCNDQIDEAFKDADGYYVDDNHCGTCGNSCAGAIPNATAACDVNDGSPRCEVVSCDAGYYQATETLCLPASSGLCNPCETDADCPSPGDRCVTWGGEQICGQDCSDTNVHDLPPGECGSDPSFVCTAFAGGPDQCVPQSGTCDCLAGNDGATRACQQTNASGTCYGSETCDFTAGWVGCSAATPVDEVCNGVDDDCDNLVDEGLSHDPITCSVTNAYGTCTAAYVCAGTEEWRCDVATPLAEVCNFQDENCDGEADEDFKDAEGRYVHNDHCGTCGNSCEGAIPNAVATCQTDSGVPRCQVASCASGYYQASPTTCLPATDSLCNACQTDANCPTPGDRCLELDDGSFCGRDCSADNAHGNAAGACPEGYACVAVSGAEQCVPTSGACSCLPDDDGASRTCSVDNGWGTCFGAEICDVDAGWIGCTAATPAEESCNGQDDDCDNFVDEALVHEPASCAITNSWGTCTANWLCAGSEGWTCAVATPSQDICDGADNDCDGEVDEAFRDADGLYVDDGNCGSCGISCSKAIPNATASCVAVDGVPRCLVASCDVGYYQVGPLSCLPAQDTTCLPCVSDANCPTPGDRCITLAEGSFCGRDCSADNVHGNEQGVCDAGFSCELQPDGASQCVPTSGACSCLVADDGQQRTCSNDNAWGTCYGVETCDVDHGWIGCSAAVPAEERCNGADDDCDNVVDEGLIHDPTTCANTTADGTCTDTWVCGGSEGWQCSPDTPAAETCNFADDDCDGEVDEIFRDDDGYYVHDSHCGTCGASCDGAIPNATAACDLNGGSPRCEVVSCASGYYKAGDTLCLPVSESLCNPCQSDRDCPTPGDRCVTLDDGGFCGKDCSAANVHGLPAGECGDDSFECVVIADGPDQCVPKSGTCSCLAGNDGAIRACSVGNGYGTCFGTEACDFESGWVGCSAATPAAEACNGVDDDCDNLVDEGVTHSPATCESTSGAWTCSAPWVCDGTDGWRCDVATPVAESCNFADDNCDDQVDETFVDALGRYVHDEHCGTCNNSCVGVIPHATATCSVSSGAPRCEVASCDVGYYQAGPLTCLQATDATCLPCQTDDNCPTPGDRCLDMDGGRFCGRDCGDGNLHGNPAGECPADFYCSAADGEQCIPMSGTCTCLVEHDGNARTCFVDNAWGTCFGSQVCEADGGWDSCTAATPVVEICNGVDDDCDGAADDVEGLGTACTVDNSVGSCPGTLACVAGQGAAPVCVGPTPAPEICNGQDDDCNGAIDDGFLVGGKYVTDAHCGQCGNDCSVLANAAAAHCDSAPETPVCVIDLCDAGFVRSADGRCLPANLGACDACASDATCTVAGATCADLGDGSYCLNPCDVEANCQASYSCQLVGGSSYCVPDTDSCTCDGTQALVRSCTVTYDAPEPAEDYTCGGSQQCEPAGWSACAPDAEECNLLDDDCDGATDEGYVDGNGRYTSDENCGGCGNNCTLIIYGGGAGVCNSIVDPPVCSLQCSGNCIDVNANPNDGCECCDPQPDDLPDIEGIDANCDGIDGNIATGVFVSKAGDDANDGSRFAPLRTIQAGIDLAANTPGKRDVFVASGVYTESITLADGIGVYGGYSGDYTEHDPGPYESAILALPPTADEPGAVNAIDIVGGAAGSTVFFGFTVYGYDVKTAGQASYALYLRDVDETVSVVYTTVVAGSGGKGTRGGDGSDGDDGTPGSAGVDALDLTEVYGIIGHTCTSSEWSDGGAAGTKTCYDEGGVGTATDGGVGGDRVCPVFVDKVTVPPDEHPSQFGADGLNGGADGGDAGRDVYHQPYQCEGYNTFEGIEEGGDGADGAAGTSGLSGAGCDLADGSVIDGLWVAGTAADGGAGGHGGGGGGGGSGAGAWVETSCNAKGYNYDNMGGTGGGAGAGGCAGTAGTSATSGGGAFAIFVVWTSTPTTFPEIAYNVIHGGFGGDGGAGGNGGVGGAGGGGGLGGAGGGDSLTSSPTGEPDPSYPAFRGGKGGNGGGGGSGGGGGGGCGGPAIGIYAAGYGTATLPTWDTANDFLTLGTGGAGGLGGFSLGNPGGTGSNGTAADTNF